MLERAVLHNQQQLLQAEVISPRHLVAVVRGLLDSCSKNAGFSDRIQLALDRLAQSIQVAHSSGCLYGNTRTFSEFSIIPFKSKADHLIFFSIIDELMQALRTLPYNRLLDIVVRRYS